MDGETEFGTVPIESTVSLGAEEEVSDRDGPSCTVAEADRGWNSESNI
jgi:hypothetical protein